MHHERGSRYLVLTLGLVLTGVLATACGADKGSDATYAAATAAPAEVTFGLSAIGQESARTTTVTAASPEVVVVQEIRIEGADADAFRLASELSLPMEINAEDLVELALDLRFAPERTGDHASSLVIEFADAAVGYHVVGGSCSGDPNVDSPGSNFTPAPLVIPLSGTGVEAGLACCPDEDEDGYVALSDNCRVCSEDGPPRTEPAPCDDDPDIHPDQDDPCEGVDNDCDGQTDEDFVSDATTCGRGACAATGVRTCVDGRVEDSCEPGTPPADVDATCDGIDSDCDGDTDEDFETDDTTCGTGVCAATGELLCEDGTVIDTCEPGTPETTTDDCDGRDNDCDGDTDEDFEGDDTVCGSGVCAAEGETVCEDGAVVDTCEPGEPTSQTDDCDALDNDCDGDTDEDFEGGATTCGDGTCTGTGELLCEDGAVIDTCVPIDPTPGVVDECNGVDDDCDGLTDEDFESETTACGTGVCANEGETVCVDGDVLDTCVPLETEFTTDESCDDLDSDCDGLTDEEFQVEVTTCGDEGCEGQGQLICEDGQEIDTCVPPEPDPDIVDVCNGVDDNCDGDTDEDFESETTTCGVANCANEGVTVCVDGDVVDTCEPLGPLPDVVDVCNGLDDDCDGETDEDFQGEPTTCGGEGDCAGEGELVCEDGAVVDTCVPPVSSEARDIPCDDIDNDCDGDTDEDLPLGGGETGCEPTVPILWDGTAPPAVSEDCFGFTATGLETAPIVAIAGEPPAQVGPGLEVRDGALWVRTLPVGVQLWYEIAFEFPVPEQTAVAQMTVTLEEFFGDDASPGAAILLSNGSHVVWLNVVRRGVMVHVGEGPDQVPLGMVEALVQTSPVAVRLAIVGDTHVRVSVGDETVTFVDALVAAPVDPDGQARLRFGDWSETAGAVIGWDDLALFDLPPEQLDVDLDGADECENDCDDADPLRSPAFVDDPCTPLDEDCDPDTGLTDEGEPGAIGGPVVDGCEDAIPSLWDGETVPTVTDGCFGITTETIGAAPALSIVAGALSVDSAGDDTLTGFWTADWPDAAAPDGAWLVARARVRVTAYGGATAEPGNALFLANGTNRVWLNLAADRVALLGGAGDLLAEAPFDTSLAFGDWWLVVAPNDDVYVMANGRTVLSVPGGAALAAADTALAAGFGDASALAGATALWDDFGFFALTEAGQIDLDGDGVAGCRGDCDDTDPTVFPGQGEDPSDAIDHNCDGDPGKKPYCRGPACVGPLPDPDPVPGGGGCYRVFEYPDGWDGDAEVINMGHSGGTIGDVNGDGIVDVGFNHDDESYVRFGQMANLGLGAVPEDPLALAPTGVDVSFGAADEPVSQLGLAAVAGGDLNGDGLSDLILGTRFALDNNNDRVGRIYVFFGREEWNAFYDVGAEANIIIEKSALDGWTASSVVAVRDINGDGIAEIGVKAKDSIRINARFYVFFGQESWTTDTRITLTSDDADLRYIDPGATYLVTGVGDAVHIAGVGDFDGDGFGDLALAAPGRDYGDGALFLVFGGNGPDYWPVDAADLLLQPNVLRIARPTVFDQTVIGAHVAQSGDLNGDGFSDLVITGRRFMYVVLGRPRAQLLSELGVADLTDPTTVYDPVLMGDYAFEDPDPTFPWDLAYTGDVDGDGYDDVLISTGEDGGPAADLTNVTYLLYGAPVLDWPLTDEIRDVYDACFHHGQSGTSAHIGRGGDYNADGLDDMIFAAPLRQEVRVLYGDWY